jgi:hypothetical protein
MTAFLTTWRLPLLLTGLCAVLAIVLARVIDAPSPVSTASSPEAEAAGGDAMADRSFELGPIASFGAVVERPLFSRSRRPAPADRSSTADVRTSNTGAPFVLSGVIVAGATRVAFLQPRSQPKTLRVLEGETVEGWKIEKILPYRVVIGNGDAREELALQDRIAPAPAPGDGRPQQRNGRRPPPVPPPAREDMQPGQQLQRGDAIDGAVEDEPQ